jgi:hypothetical protein
MPKDVTVVYNDENGNPAMIKQYHFSDEEDIQGWYYFEGEPYLPKTYLRKQLCLSKKDLEKIITNNDVRTEEVTNEYRTFTVYNLSDSQKVKDGLGQIL